MHFTVFYLYSLSVGTIKKKGWSFANSNIMRLATPLAKFVLDMDTKSFTHCSYIHSYNIIAYINHWPV